jgi:hypothetical protein
MSKETFTHGEWTVSVEIKRSEHGWGIPISRPSRMASSCSRRSPKPLILNGQLKRMLSEQGLTKAAGSEILRTRELVTEPVRYFFVGRFDARRNCCCHV